MARQGTHDVGRSTSVLPCQSVLPSTPSCREIRDSSNCLPSCLASICSLKPSATLKVRMRMTASLWLLPSSTTGEFNPSIWLTTLVASLTNPLSTGSDPECVPAQIRGAMSAERAGFYVTEITSQDALLHNCHRGCTLGQTQTSGKKDLPGSGAHRNLRSTSW